MGARVAVVSGSALFGRRAVQAASSALAGSTVALYDANVARLGLVASQAERLGEGVSFEVAGSLEETLTGADFVVVGLSPEPSARRLDWEIPFRHGIRQVLGECGGPGGAFRTLRMVPKLVSVARDMERLCPGATMLVCTEPVDRLCLAVVKATRVNVVGIGGGADAQLRRVAGIIGVPSRIFEASSAGLSGFSWFTGLHYVDGSDAYPSLHEALAKAKGTPPLGRVLHDRFGLYPSADDSHLGEFLAYAWDSCPPGLRGLEWIEAREREEADAMVGGPVEADGAVSGAFRVVSGILTDSGHVEPQLNLLNAGQVANIAEGAIVESPAIVDRTGVRPMKAGSLPQGIAAMSNMQIMIRRMVVEAALRGDRGLALKAVLADPVTHDTAAAEAVFDELFEAHRVALPQFG